MTKYLLPTIGLALLGGIALLGLAPTAAGAGEAVCCGPAGCEMGCAAAQCPTCENSGCHGCECCPRCGCKLVPVCQITCATKKTSEHKYCCKCKDICIPGVTRLCDRGQGCENCNGSANGCGACDPGCQDCGDCRCRVREIHKLTVFSVTKETPVRECTVQWACPNCSNCGACGTTTAPSMAPATPGPAAPAPAPSTNRLPPPPKTTDLAPSPEDIRTARAGS